ncbi:c-type cytochrome [Aureliella helgolandensis]|uniref:Cytochrome c n=1 Tax=Aureliella helgolandensis TaxID=2527968 RepID=A0A518G8F7_9BACT|nr:c-type cytochrome [Aureliella helgolandensis]QDV24872.1 Cytochrome c [Aureliella helgolandensis]
MHPAVNMPSPRPVVVLALLVWLLPQVASSQDSRARRAATLPVDAPAFVPGFERFGRHADIDSIASGRLLISELSCGACHATDVPDLQPKGGPRLESVGERLQADWLYDYLNSSHAPQHGTTMPNVLSKLDRNSRQDVALALAAFLATQRKPLPEIKATGAIPVPLEFWKLGDVQRGTELFHQVGCVACHAPDPDYETVVESNSALDELFEELSTEELEEMGLASAARKVDSVPLGELGNKYSLRGLARFLHDPLSVRPSGRMPGFKLLPSDAADIASYLLSRESTSASETSSSGSPAEQLGVLHSETEGYEQALAGRMKTQTLGELAEQGRGLFASMNCNQCHALSGEETATTLPPMEQLDSQSAVGCLSDSPTRSVRFSLDAVQVGAIRTALADAATPRGLEPPSRLQHLLLQRNCYACHEREELGGVGRFRKPFFETVAGIDLGDEGRLPPPLTNVGRKLQLSWLKKVLLGQNADIRKHMHIRMPAFGAELADELPQLLATSDEVDSAPESAVWDSTLWDLGATLPQVGRELVDNGCVQCHPFRGYALPGVVGVDLQGIANRVQPSWFSEFIENPGLVKKQTRMPTFFPKGKSQQPHLLGGNVHSQIGAIWSYLRDLDKQPLPEKISAARAENYELKPTDRPILLRTFMKDAGTHALAVGFPAGVHFAFDTERVRLANAWRGRFIDAQGTWFIRFAPLAEPLGDRVQAIQFGAPFARPKDESASWSADQLWPPHGSRIHFRGYRLDEGGIPTFLYEVDGIGIEDRIEPHGQQGLLRTLSLRPVTSHASVGEESAAAEAPETDRLWFNANYGHDLQILNAFESKNELGLRVRLEVSSSDLPVSVRAASDDGAVWAVPLDVKQPIDLKVEYQW